MDLNVLEVVLGISRKTSRQWGWHFEHVRVFDHCQTGVYVICILLDLVHQGFELACQNTKLTLINCQKTYKF